MNTQRMILRKLAITALFAALAVVLELMTTFIPGLNAEMPFGGRIFGISMLPIILLSLICGIRFGLTGGFLLAAVNVLSNLSQIMTWGLTPQALAGTIFLDYLIPFTLLGLAGIFRKNTINIKSFILGTSLVCGIRYVCHCISGLVFFSAWSGEMNIWIYSLFAYNLPYMASSTALCLVVGVLVIKPLANYLKLDVQQPSNNQDVDSE